MRIGKRDHIVIESSTTAITGILIRHQDEKGLPMTFCNVLIGVGDA